MGELKEEEEEPELHNSAVAFEEENLWRASQLVNSLLYSSYSVRSFHGKWRIIREKLQQLNWGLTVAAAGTVDRCHNSPLAELLQSVVSTVNDAQKLVHRCSDEAFAGGKLQMRSDLDVVCSKIELVLKHHLSKLYASGVLADSLAIIVSRPAAGASRDDMRFYVKDLFSRLRIGGDTDMRTRALAALNDALRDDDKYARITVLETDDGVSLLATFLESEDAGLRAEAAEAVSIIAGFESYRSVLVTAGVISPLIRVLEKTEGEISRRRAARALRKLTENSDNAWSVSAHGGVTALLKVCAEATSGAELVGSACRILRNLSCVREIKRFMVEQEAVSVFMNILSAREEEGFQVQAIDFLYTLAADDDMIKQEVLQKGAMELLLRLLDAQSPQAPKAREVSLRAIDFFCFSSAEALSKLVSSGFLSRITIFLKDEDSSTTQELALKSAARLCSASDESKKAMGDAGFISVLLPLLDAKSPQIREMAADVLCSLISVQKNRRRFIQEDCNVSRVLQLLGPSPDGEKPSAAAATNKSLLSVIMSLTDSSSGRRKIVASGYMKNLEKLAETDAIDDAKKIVKKLSGNRFWNIFNGIFGVQRQ